MPNLICRDVLRATLISYQSQVVGFFVVAISLKFYLPPCVKLQITWCFFANGHRQC